MINLLPLGTSHSEEMRVDVVSIVVVISAPPSFLTLLVTFLTFLVVAADIVRLYQRPGCIEYLEKDLVFGARDEDARQCSCDCRKIKTETSSERLRNQVNLSILSI